MDYLGTAPGATYYTFVDSGAFTASYSTITHIDGNGLWLNGTGGISLSTVTFDLLGSASGTSTATYITANILTSTATFYGLTFSTSTSGSYVANLHNVTVSGSDAGLSWQLKKYGGTLIGDAYENNDVNNKVQWYPFAPSVVSPAFTAVSSFSVTAQWGANGDTGDVSYTLQLSTASNF